MMGGNVISLLSIVRRCGTGVAVLGCVVPLALQSQPSTDRSDSADGSFITGRASLSVEAYGELPSRDSGRGLPTNRPDLFGRLDLHPTFHFGTISVPLSIGFSFGDEESNGGSRNLLDAMIDPANSIGISPKFGEVQLHAGSHAPTLSSLLDGGTRLFGVGVDATIEEELQLVFSAGYADLGSGTHRPTGADDDSGSNEAESETEPVKDLFLVGRVAWKSEETELGLDIVRGIGSDPEVIDGAWQLDSVVSIPHWSQAIGIDAKTRIGSWRVEAAVSGLLQTAAVVADKFAIRDTNGKRNVPDLGTTLEDIACFLGFKPHLSSTAGYAGRFRVASPFAGRSGIGIDFEADLTSRDYRPPTSPYQATNRLQFRLLPRARFNLLGESLNLRGDVNYATPDPFDRFSASQFGFRRYGGQLRANWRQSMEPGRLFLAASGGYSHTERGENPGKEECSDLYFSLESVADSLMSTSDRYDLSLSPRLVIPFAGSDVQTIAASLRLGILDAAVRRTFTSYGATYRLQLDSNRIEIGSELRYSGSRWRRRDTPDIDTHRVLTGGLSFRWNIARRNEPVFDLTARLTRSGVLTSTLSDSLHVDLTTMSFDIRKGIGESVVVTTHVGQRVVAGSVELVGRVGVGWGWR